MSEIYIPLPDWAPGLRPKKEKHHKHKLLSPNVKLHHFTAYKRDERIRLLIQNEILAIRFDLQAREILNECQVSLEILNGATQTKRALISICYVHPGAKSMDYGNLVGTLKMTQDIIAATMIPGLAPGRADGDKRLEWEYAQRKGAPKEYALHISVGIITRYTHIE